MLAERYWCPSVRPASFPIQLQFLGLLARLSQMMNEADGRNIFLSWHHVQNRDGYLCVCVYTIRVLLLFYKYVHTQTYVRTYIVQATGVGAFASTGLREAVCHSECNTSTVAFIFRTICEQPTKQTGRQNNHTCASHQPKQYCRHFLVASKLSIFWEVNVSTMVGRKAYVYTHEGSDIKYAVLKIAHFFLILSALSQLKKEKTTDTT